MDTKTNKVLITGSSGYVASDLVPRLKKKAKTIGVDKSFSEYTDIEVSIERTEFRDYLDRFYGEEVVIINLAAARFDFGATAKDYFRLNVECHANFLEALDACKIKKFIHISSVASIDGRNIQYSDQLKCDDAYRATKYLQEELIQNWCYDRDIELSILYPSAIFSEDPRSDTNIGKLQSASKFLPFIPSIDVIKSLTFLPNLSKFIVGLAVDEIPPGKYLTIEKPLMTVSSMIQIISGRPIRLIRIPWFQHIVKIVAHILHVLGGFGKVDLKLTPNRVVKLFSDTSYNRLENTNIDTDAYGLRYNDQLEDLLKTFKDS